MNQISKALQRQADVARPQPSLDDVLQRVYRPQQARRAGRVAAISLAAVALVAALGAVVSQRSSGSSSTNSVTTPVVEADIARIGGMIVADVPAEVLVRSTLDRADLGNASGPQSIVVRRLDGSLSEGSAVVSFPVDDSAVRDGAIEMNTSTGALTLSSRRADGHLVVRGVGLSRDEVLAIADATVIVNGRPVFGSTAALPDFEVVAVGPLRPRLIREARIGCAELGERDVLGAMCYTGLTTSPGFEDALYTTDFQAGPTVQGVSSVVSKVGGGSATLAWEIRPGVVAFVGYSGNVVGDEQIAALVRIAERAVLISPSDWAATEPQTVAQVNDWT